MSAPERVQRLTPALGMVMCSARVESNMVMAEKILQPAAQVRLGYLHCFGQGISKEQCPREVDESVLDQVKREGEIRSGRSRGSCRSQVTQE